MEHFEDNQNLREKPRSEVVLSEAARSQADKFRKKAISVSGLLITVKISEFLIFMGVAISVAYSLLDLSTSFMVLTACLASCVYILSLKFFDSYKISSLRSLPSCSLQILTSLVHASITLMSLGYLVDMSLETRCVWFTITFLISLSCIFSFRYFLSGFVDHWFQSGRLERRVVIIGSGERAQEFIKNLKATKDTDIRICGIFDDRTDMRCPETIEGYPVLGTLDELTVFAQIARLDMLIMTLPMSAQVRMIELLKKLLVLPIEIRMSVKKGESVFHNRADCLNEELSIIEISQRPIAKWNAICKRGFDIIFASLGLILFSPLLALSALAIKIESPGPVFFRQNRFGFNNEVISVLKLRSMYHEKADPHAKSVVTKNDPRVTKVGNFIRKTSIDELPQLWNVLTGKLSLVGPRPHAVFAHTKEKVWGELIDGYYTRHKVKPGITGWAQINGLRGEVETIEQLEARVKYDLYYIENWSLSFDLYITLMTPLRLFQSGKAY